MIARRWHACNQDSRRNPQRRPSVDVTTLDGRGYARFLAAGSYFLRKYRSVLNGLNVYPVPDGDTGTNMYLTLRSAALEAYARHDESLALTAAAAAHGGLTGARGNSGVILSQMLRGFADHVRDHAVIGTFAAATALREAARSAKAALETPVDGTIVSVAEVTAEAACRLASSESDFIRFLSGIVRIGNDAVDRTTEQLPALRDAGVVDAGAAGFVYLMEGVLAFLPGVRDRTTAFPRAPSHAAVFTPSQHVGAMHFCTELVLEEATCAATDLRSALAPAGASLLVVGEPPTIKVHVHTDEPEHVRSIAARFGVPTRFKVDDMAHQHAKLLLDAPAAHSIVAVVPGPGFATIAKELGAEIVLDIADAVNDDELARAIDIARASEVYVLPSGEAAAGVVLRATEGSGKHVRVVATKNIVEGINALIAFRAGGPHALERAERAVRETRSARIVLPRDGATIAAAACDAVGALREGTDGLVTLYYGGAQREEDARRLSEEVCAAHPGTSVEYYYGGMKSAEYWIGFDA
jgi:uncharacterized protein